MFFRSGYRQMCIIFKRRCIQDRDVEGVRFFMEGRRDWKERFLPIIRNAPFDLFACMRWFIKLLLLFEKNHRGEKMFCLHLFQPSHASVRDVPSLYFYARIHRRGSSKTFLPIPYLSGNYFFQGKLAWTNLMSLPFSTVLVDLTDC